MAKRKTPPVADSDSSRTKTTLYIDDFILDELKRVAALEYPRMTHQKAAVEYILLHLKRFNAAEEADALDRDPYGGVRVAPDFVTPRDFVAAWEQRDMKA